MYPVFRAGATAVAVLVMACMAAPPSEDFGGTPRRPEKIRPGISVLLSDSASLIAGKRIGLITNQAGVDEKGESDVALLQRPASKAAGPVGKLVVLLSPEHGIHAAEDRTNVPGGTDKASGIPIVSLYGATVLPPPDSVLDKMDVLVIDLQDVGARPWTYVATMVYAMRAAAGHKLPVVVLDRPNPITGVHVEGPVLDSSIAYAGSHSPERAALPTAIYPIPMRHGMTMGELARMYNEVLPLHADLHVIPVAGWRRGMWFDDTKLPFVKPSPNMPNLASETLYPGLVWLESTNVSVGRGTDAPFQQFGAPWLDAKKVTNMLNERLLGGVKFEETRFTPANPGDGKFAGKSIPGVRVRVMNRDVIQTSRIGAAIIWALVTAHKDSVRFRPQSFNELFGVPGALDRFLKGDDPDAIIDQGVPASVAFEQASRRYWLYR